MCDHDQLMYIYMKRPIVMWVTNYHRCVTCDYVSRWPSWSCVWPWSTYVYIYEETYCHVGHQLSQMCDLWLKIFYVLRDHHDHVCDHDQLMYICGSPTIIDVFLRDHHDRVCVQWYILMCVCLNSMYLMMMKKIFSQNDPQLLFTCVS